MNDVEVFQGQTLRLMVTVKEEGALTAELFAISESDEITNEAEFEGMEAFLNTNIPDDQTAGEYPYYIRVTWDDGTTDIIATPGDCEDGDCPLPVITVCALDQEGS